MELSGTLQFLIQQQEMNSLHVAAGDVKWDQGEMKNKPVNQLLTTPPRRRAVPAAEDVITTERQVPLIITLDLRHFRSEHEVTWRRCLESVSPSTSSGYVRRVPVRQGWRWSRSRRLRLYDAMVSGTSIERDILVLISFNSAACQGAGRYYRSICNGHHPLVGTPQSLLEFLWNNCNC